MQPLVLCGLSASPASDDALSFAANLADALGASVLAAHVRPQVAGIIPAHAGLSPIPPIELDHPSSREQEVQAFEALKRAFPVSVQRRIESGDAATQLAAIADDVGALMTVVGASRHRGLRAVLGTVVGRLVAHPPCLVAVVPPGLRHDDLQGRAVICGAGPASEDLGVGFAAIWLAEKLDAPLVLVHATEGGLLHVAQLRTLGLLASEADGRSVTVEVRIVEGSPSECLDAAARDESAVAIVVGSHGKGALRGWLTGSTTHHLLGHAPCPLIVVSPETTRRVQAPGSHADVAAR